MASGLVAVDGNFSPNLAVLARSRSFMGWFNIVLRKWSHEISDHIAMQHLEFNFVWPGTNWLVAAIVLTLAQPALAAPSDPLLDGGATAPCAAGTDYSGGVDVNGNPVVPADAGAPHVPVPGTVLVPLHGNGNGKDSAYAALDGKKLDALVNPKPCR